MAFSLLPWTLPAIVVTTPPLRRVATEEAVAAGDGDVPAEAEADGEGEGLGDAPEGRGDGLFEGEGDVPGDGDVPAEAAVLGLGDVPGEGLAAAEPDADGTGEVPGGLDWFGDGELDDVGLVPGDVGVEGEEEDVGEVLTLGEPEAPGEGLPALVEADVFGDGLFFGVPTGFGDSSGVVGAGQPVAIATSAAIKTKRPGRELTSENRIMKRPFELPNPCLLYPPAGHAPLSSLCASSHGDRGSG